MHMSDIWLAISISIAMSAVHFAMDFSQLPKLAKKYVSLSIRGELERTSLIKHLWGGKLLSGSQVTLRTPVDLKDGMGSMPEERLLDLYRRMHFGLTNLLLTCLSWAGLWLGLICVSWIRDMGVVIFPRIVLLPFILCITSGLASNAIKRRRYRDAAISLDSSVEPCKQTGYFADVEDSQPNPYAPPGLRDDVIR